MQQSTEYQNQLQEYDKFLRAKAIVSNEAGFSVSDAELHESLKPHQGVSVQWAARRGRALVASSFGLGKTRTAIDLLRHSYAHNGKQQLIIAPLNVRSQFIQIDGKAMGVDIRYITSQAEADAADTPYLITNYERVRDGHINPDFYRTLGAVALDEAAILGNLGTKTQQNFMSFFSDVSLKWCFTATPAPNDYRQLLYFAEFLGVMDSGQGLTRWFQRNPDKAGDLILMPHMEEEFWLWVASWALFINLPSDLGFSDDGYTMPPLNLQWHRLAADHSKAQDLTDNFGQHYLFKDTAAGVQQAMKEKRDSLADRVTEALSIVDGTHEDRQIVIWCNLNDEQSAIERGLKERGISYSSIYGSLTPEQAEERLFDWLEKRTRVFVSKPQMFGSGANLQQSHTSIYVGLDFKFRDFIQSIHRLLRFGQMHAVNTHLIHTDAEDHVVDILMKKWQQHDEMTARMSGIIREYGLTNEALASEIRRSIGVNRQEKKSSLYHVINNDCVLELMTMPDNSVDEIVTSIPFGNHYEYVASLNDFGHNQTDGDFWVQMDFLIPHLLRVLKPGRMACIHVKDRLLYGHQTPHGMMEVDYFSDDCNRAFRKNGFVSYGRITIPTDVVRENSSTNRLGWSENCKDGSKMGVGMPEYVLLFRKPQTDKSRSYADEPVRKDKADYTRGRWQIDAHQMWRSDGTSIDMVDTAPADNPELLAGMDSGQIWRWYKTWSKQNPYNYEQHVAFNEAVGDRLPATFMVMPPEAPAEYEDSVWTDILFMRTFNMSQARKRVEKHVCPLPMDIVKRLIVRYSNPSEVILDPFTGIGTVPALAVELGRKGLGTELNPMYYEAAISYCEDAEIKASSPSLFDLMAAD